MATTTSTLFSSNSFLGLRKTNLPTTKTFLPTRPARKSCIKIRAELLSPSLVISLSTGLSLFLGRFVFFNFQRENVAKQGLPTQNGRSHFEAGDSRAKEYVGLLKSNDPVGFNELGDPLGTLWLTISWPPLAMDMTPTSLVERSSNFCKLCNLYV